MTSAITLGRSCHHEGHRVRRRAASFSTTLHRKWRAWLEESFNDALLDETTPTITCSIRAATAGSCGGPDNIDQRVQELIKDFAGGAIGLSMGIFGVFTSLYFVGMKLLETSTVVEGLTFLGIYGSCRAGLRGGRPLRPVNT